MASVLYTIGGAVMNALAFSSTIFLFSKLMNHGLKERKRYDMVLERHQRTRDEWKIDRIKLLYFI